MYVTKESEIMDRKLSIKVAGVEFTADDVVSAVVKIDGREVHIGEADKTERKIGFDSTTDKNAKD